MKNLAPIVIITYSRLKHLEKTIAALQQNSLAGESELHIFSDAPKPGDEHLVQKVRDYIKTVDGFKRVVVTERTTNMGSELNTRNAEKELLKEYGKLIIMEEDIVTAPGFLQFINDGLNFYEDDERVLNISGHRIPFDVPQGFDKDIFALQRFDGWGIGTWSHKFDPFGIDIKTHGFESFMKDKKRIKEFKKNADGVFPLLQEVYYGRLQASDLELTYFQYIYNKISIFPRNSLVQNIGHDGTGLHCGVSGKFEHKQLWEKRDNFVFIKDIQVDEQIKKIYYEFSHRGIMGIVIELARKTGILPYVKACIKFFYRCTEEIIIGH